MTELCCVPLCVNEVVEGRVMCASCLEKEDDWRKRFVGKTFSKEELVAELLAVKGGALRTLSLLGWDKVKECGETMKPEIIKSGRGVRPATSKAGEAIEPEPHKDKINNDNLYRSILFYAIGFINGVIFWALMRIMIGGN